jgi:hypothetical protein
VIIYNIYEILRDEKYKEIMDGGNYHKKANLLRRTANHYRHTNEPLPANAMTLLEAKTWIKIFLYDWLKEKQNL